MNNAVSADVTLFSRVHPDIVKRISVSSVIVSALLAIGGIGAFVTSLRMGDATSTMSMVFMTVGTILILTALFHQRREAEGAGIVVTICVEAHH